MLGRHLSEIELVEYADGEIALSRVAPVEEHLHECAACAHALEKLREAVAATGYLQVVDTPPGLRARVAAEVGAGSAGEITCREAKPLIHQQIDGALSPLGLSALEQHLAACRLCRLELAALSATVRLVRSLTLLKAPARIGEAVAAAEQSRRRRRAWGPVLRPALAAAAVAAVGGLLMLVRPALQPEVGLTGARVASEPNRPVSVAQQSEAEPAVAPESTLATAESAIAAAASAIAAAEAELLAPAPPEAGPAAMQVAAESPRPISSRPAPVRLASLPPRTETLIPPAVLALRAVASGVSGRGDLQLVSNMARDRFATLDSETALSQVPDLSGFEGLENGGQWDESGSNSFEKRDEKGQGEANSLPSRGPMEGARLAVPLV